jgi:hypothetical protein
LRVEEEISLKRSTAKKRRIAVFRVIGTGESLLSTPQKAAANTSRGCC